MAGISANRLSLLGRETSVLVEDLRRSVVLVQSAHGHGSGLIWDSAGLIVTNHHVVARDQARVELSDGRLLAAAVVGRDVQNDLAALPAAPPGPGVTRWERAA